MLSLYFFSHCELIKTFLQFFTFEKFCFDNFKCIDTFLRYGLKLHTITELKFLESALESGPQLIIQLTYLVLEGEFDTSSVFFIISICSSFFNLADAINARDNSLRHFSSFSLWGMFYLFQRIMELTHHVCGFVLLAVHYSAIGTFIYVVKIHLEIQNLQMFSADSFRAIVDKHFLSRFRRLEFEIKIDI